MTPRSFDRRIHRRDSARTRGIVSARIRPGRDVTVINLSAGGILIEASVRLRPGIPVELQLATTDQQQSLGSRVLRCAVSRLHSNAVWYRAALAFDSPVPRFTDARSTGYGVPSIEAGVDTPLRVGPTRRTV